MRLSPRLVTYWLVMMAMVSCTIGQDPIKVNQQRAEPLILAVLSYEKDVGSFPKELDDLVPKYLNSLPQTNKGEEFFYSTDSLNGFILSFTVEKSDRKSFGCAYTNQTRGWECSYGD